MITRKKRINAFINLGKHLKYSSPSIEIEEITQLCRSRNAWFTPENTLLSLQNIADHYLQESSLQTFLNAYPEISAAKKIGVVMAGNLPGVGFHDALCVLLSGHHLLAKLSKDDTPLMLYLLDTLRKLEPEFSEYITIVDRINAADAYIATGSDNTARYFTYYFASKPHIIRKNRTSVGILTGKESATELSLLAQDILQYFGLGCRNVSKLYVPEAYDFIPFYEGIESLHDQYAYHHKYFNNYEYNKSILLVNRTPHQDNGFLILTENPALVSPLSVVYYETYTSPGQVTAELEANVDKIQCIVGSGDDFPGAIPFGKAQSPGLFDFADQVDTMAFLSTL